jgi:hypothetical protein
MFITSKRCNSGYNAGYDADGAQWARGPFLVIIAHETERYADVTRKLRAFVRRATLRQSGHFMTGTIVAKLDGKDITIAVSGTYGHDGLPHDSGFKNHADKSVKYDDRPIVDLWDVSHPLPEELARTFWAGGGHNGAGSEGAAMRKWAEENQEMLRRWRRPNAEKPS